MTAPRHDPYHSDGDGDGDGPSLQARRGERGRARLAVAMMTAGGVLVVAWPVLLMGTAGVSWDLVALLAHASGTAAGYGVLVMLVLMSRWPLLERGIGADVLARWHARGGRLVLGLVLLHALAAVLAWSLLTRQDPVSALAQVLTWPGLVTATVGTAVLCAVAVVSARSVRRRVRWETWFGLHLSTYLAVALSFSHQLAGPDLAGMVGVQVAWALAYTLTFALVLRHRVLAPLLATARHRLRVVAVVPEAPGVASIIVQGRHLGELRPEPGQFFRWRFLTSRSWVTAHPFSLSAPPVGDRLRLTVKALGSGSGRLHQVPVGTRVVAEGPYGAMTAARRTRRDVLLVAGGVGITPMRALFETMPLEPGQDLMLLYRARDPEQLVFRHELDALAERRRARVVYLLGEDPHLLSAGSLTRLVPSLATRDVYLCGPPGLSAAVRESLREVGLPRAHVHEESFAL